MGGEEPSSTGGVKPMDIRGRMISDMERIRGMSDAERAWRSQYLKDQVLAPNEPLNVPDLRKELLNPIRRFYRKPLDSLFTALIPKLGAARAGTYRAVVPKVFTIIAASYVIFYYLKYDTGDWTRKGGFVVQMSRTRSLPGDPDFPRVSERTETSDYADKGFKNRKVLLD